MSYKLKIEVKEDVLWVTATGTRSLETVLAISKDILAACTENKVTKVLIDIRELEGRLSTMDAHDIPDEYYPNIPVQSVITRNAIVDLEGIDSEFFETVAVNRGYNVRIFLDPSEAFNSLKK